MADSTYWGIRSIAVGVRSGRHDHECDTMKVNGRYAHLRLNTGRKVIPDLYPIHAMVHSRLRYVNSYLFHHQGCLVASVGAA